MKVTILNVQNGMEFYDASNDRYLTVDGIDGGSRTCSCIVEEFDVDMDDYVVIDRFNFYVNELNNFKYL